MSAIWDKLGHFQIMQAFYLRFYNYLYTRLVYREGWTHLTTQTRCTKHEGNRPPFAGIPSPKHPVRPPQKALI